MGLFRCGVAAPGLAALVVDYGLCGQVWLSARVCGSVDLGMPLPTVADSTAVPRLYVDDKRACQSMVDCPDSAQSSLGGAAGVAHGFSRARGSTHSRAFPPGRWLVKLSVGPVSQAASACGRVVARVWPVAMVGLKAWRRVTMAYSQRSRVAAQAARACPAPSWSRGRVVRWVKRSARTWLLGSAPRWLARRRLVARGGRGG